MERQENTEYVPTQSQVETLMSDWLQGSRDGETFIHKDTRGAIQKKRTGSALSEYSRGDLSGLAPSEVLRQSRIIAQGVVDGMTDRPIRVMLGGSTSFTDNETINVATDYFDDDSLSTGEKIDILTGYSIHEACHIRHSDFKRLSAKRDDDPAINRLKRDVDNILEDERIEQLLGTPQEDGGDGMPGLSDYLGCCKRHSFGTYEAAKQSGQVTERIPQFLNALVGAIRYPSMLTEDMVRKNFKELDEVRKILRPFPKSPKGVMAATDRIVEVMKEMLDDDRQQQDSQSGKQSKDKKQQPGNGNATPDAPSGSRSGKNGGKQGGQGGGDATKKLAEALSSSQAQNILSAAETATAAPKAEGNNAACIKSSNDEKSYVNGECEKDGGDGAGGSNSITYIVPAQGSKDSYSVALASVKRYVPAMAKALRCRSTDKDYELQGEKNGKLNTNKLVLLKTGNTNIFSKRGTITSDKACVCLLIDESGSMRGGGRKEATREAAVLINEAIRHISQIRLFIYGYTDNHLTVYAEGGREDRWALGSTKATGGTPTAEAMRIASSRIRRMTDDGCLMLVLTDGQPNDVAATQQQDALLAKRRFVVVGVDLVGGKCVEDVFRNSISTNDMKTLAPQIAGYVKKKLKKMMTRHDSND